MWSTINTSKCAAANIQLCDLSIKNFLLTNRSWEILCSWSMRGYINVHYTVNHTIQQNRNYSDQIIELVQIMSSQWLILLLLISLLQLAVTGPIGKFIKTWICWSFKNSWNGTGLSHCHQYSPTWRDRFDVFL